MDGDAGVAAIFVIAFLLALLPAGIARSKGHNFALWYFYALVLFIVALIHALCLQSRKSETVSRTKDISAYADVLTKLADLRDRGVISDVEFEAKKRELNHAAE